MLSRPTFALVLLCSPLLGACTPGVGIDVRRPDAVGEAQVLPMASSLPAIAAATSSTATADLDGPFEAAPRMPSSDLLPGFALSGPGYRIAEQAQVVDYFGQFELRTDVGSLVADGSQVLKLRVRELGAVRALDKLGSSEVFVAAMARTAKRPVIALRQVAMEPVDTLSGLPTGIGRFLVRSVRNIRDLALDLNDSARDALADDDDDTAGDDGSRKEEQDLRVRSQKIATSAALRYIGYTKARREIARHVGADPYSTNPLLRDRLDQLAWSAWSGARLTSYGLGLIGGATADVIGYAKDAYELVWELPPEDLKRRNLKVLEELGITGKPARDLIRRGKAFTLTQQTEFVELLRLPLFAAARTQLFEQALQADREVHARFLIDALRMLRNAEVSGATATVLGTSPALRRADGSHVIAVPVDYLHWTREIAAFAWRDDLIGNHNLLLVTGSLSPQALDAFSQAGWSVRERVEPQMIVPQVQSAQTAPLR